jgi:hypothetical protein
MARKALSTPAEGSITKGTNHLLFSSCSASFELESLFSATLAVKFN